MKPYLPLALLALCLLSGCADNQTVIASDSVPALTEEAEEPMNPAEIKNPEEAENPEVSENPEVADNSEETNPPAEALPFLYKITDEGEAWVYSYTGEETEAVIPSHIDGAPVTKLYSSLFSKSGLLTVTLPETLTEIQRAGSATLTEVIIPAGIAKLEPEWFEGFRELKQYTVIGEGAYRSENGVIYTADMKTLLLAPHGLSGEFTVPDGVERLADKAFCYSSVSRIALPASLRTIGSRALCCESLMEVQFSEGLEEIGEFAFCNAALTEAKLPKTLKRIGDSAFTCPALERVTLFEGLESIGSSAFSRTQLSEIYIPSTLKECGTFPVGTDAQAAVSLPSFSGVFAEFAKYPNAFLRNGTLLDNALHSANLASEGEIELFIDLTEDGFPEMVCFDREMWLYRYDCEKGCWDGFDTTGIRLCEEEGTNTRFLLVKQYTWAGWEEIRCDITDGGLELTNTVYVSLSPKDWYSEEMILSYCDVPPYHTIKEITKESVIEEYGLNGISQVYCGGFLAEPYGEPVEYIEINGGRVTEFPYVQSEYPKKLSLFINGEDILNGAPLPEGVSYNYWTRTLTLEGAKLHSEEGHCINVNFRDIRFSSLNIEIIGDCELFSDTVEAISGNVSLRFLGSGTLTTKGITATSTEADFTFCDGVTVNEISGNKSGIKNPREIILEGSARVTASKICRSTFAAVSNIIMSGSSRLSVGSKELQTTAISNVQQITLSGSSLLEVTGDGYAISTCCSNIIISHSAALHTDSQYGICANCVCLYGRGTLSTETLDTKSVRIYGGTLECRNKLGLDEVVSPYADPQWHFGEVAVYGRAAFSSGDTEWVVEEYDTDYGTNATPKIALRRKLTVTVTPEE